MDVNSYGGVGLQASSRRLQGHYSCNLETLCLNLNHVCLLDSLPFLICILTLNGIDMWVDECGIHWVITNWSIGMNLIN